MRCFRETWYVLAERLKRDGPRPRWLLDDASLAPCVDVDSIAQCPMGNLLALVAGNARRKHALETIAMMKIATCTQEIENQGPRALSQLCFHIHVYWNSM